VHPLTRADGHPSRAAVAGSLERSTRELGRAALNRSRRSSTAVAPLPPDLAPGGVYRAAQVTLGAGGLLHHRFTLTPGVPGAVCFLWHCPAGRPGSVLPTTLPCGARTFLGAPDSRRDAAARPAHPPLPPAYGPAVTRPSDARGRAVPGVPVPPAHQRAFGLFVSESGCPADCRTRRYCATAAARTATAMSSTACRLNPDGWQAG